MDSDHSGQLTGLSIGVLCLTVPQRTETFIVSHVRALSDRGLRPMFLGIHELPVGAKPLLDDSCEFTKVVSLKTPSRGESFSHGLFAGLTFLPASAGKPLKWCHDTYDPKLGWQSSLARSLKQYRATRFLKSCSLIHAHYGPAGAFAVPIKRKLRIPLVTMFHGFDATRLPREEPGLYKDLWKEGDAFLTASEFLRGRIIDLGAPAENTVAIGSPVDPERFPFKVRLPQPGKPTSILFVARLTEKKGLPYLIRATGRLMDSGKKVLLNVAGEGELRQPMEALVDQIGLRNVVRFLGALDHDGVIREMLDCDIFALPSVEASTGDCEGLPTVLLEAQLTGVPIVATLHSGIPEAVVDGKSAVLVPEKDSEALTKAIGTLLDHPERWAEMGRAGREHVISRWSTDVYMKRLLDIYCGLLGSKADLH